jgi:hypothetical protein
MKLHSHTQIRYTNMFKGMLLWTVKLGMLRFSLHIRGAPLVLISPSQQKLYGVRWIKRVNNAESESANSLHATKRWVTHQLEITSSYYASGPDENWLRSNTKKTTHSKLYDVALDFLVYLRATKEFWVFYNQNSQHLRSVITRRWTLRTRIMFNLAQLLMFILLLVLCSIGGTKQRSWGTYCHFISTLKKEAVRSSETLANTSNITWRKNLEDQH